MKKWTFTLFVVSMVLVWAVAFGGLTANLFFGVNIDPNNTLGFCTMLSVLILLVVQPIWALIAGTMHSRTGWIAAGSPHTPMNYIGLITMNFMLAVATMIVATVEVHKTGKIFPKPSEC